MSVRDSTTLGVLAALALLVAAIGGAMAISVDTETSTTTSTSDLTDGDEIALNATSQDKYTLQVVNGTSNAEAQFIDPSTGETVATFSDFEQVSGDHYRTNISDSELRERVPLTDDGAQDEYRVKLVNDSTLDSPSTSNITVYTNATDVSAVAADADVTENDGILGYNVLSQSTAVDIEQKDIPADANTTVIVQSDNQTVADELTGLVDSDASEGAIVPATVQVDGEYEEVYYKSAADGASGTYTVLQEDGDLEVHLGEDYEGDYVDVSAEDTDLDITDAFSVYGYSTDALGATFTFF